MAERIIRITITERFDIIFTFFVAMARELRQRSLVDHKPSSVLPMGVVVIYLGQMLPSVSSDQPEGMERATPFPSYLVLLRMGFAVPPVSPPGR